MTKTIIYFIFILIPFLSNGQNTFSFSDISINGNVVKDNGDIIFCGFQNQQSVIGKINANNSIAWIKKTSATFINNIQVKNNSIYFNGADFNGTVYNNYIGKLDPNGNLVWSRFFTTTDWMFFKFSNDKNTGNCIAVVGKSSFGIPIMGLDTNGLLLWSKSFPFTDPAFSFSNLAIDSFDNTYLFYGKYNDIYLAKISNIGNLDWHNKYTFPTGYDFVPYDFIASENNRLIGCGHTESPEDGFLLEFDLNGNFIQGIDIFTWEGEPAIISISESDSNFYLKTYFTSSQITDFTPFSGIIEMDDSLNITDRFFYPNYYSEHSVSSTSNEIISSFSNEYSKFDTMAFVYCDTVPFLISQQAISPPINVSSVNNVTAGLSFSNLLISFTSTTSVLSPNCITSVAEENLENSISLFPNPSVGNFIFSLENESINGQILVYSVQGKLIYADEFENVNEVQLSMNLDNGMYLFIYQNKSGALFQKPLIIHN